MNKTFLERAEDFIKLAFPEYKKDSDTAPFIRYVQGQSEIVVYPSWEKVYKYSDYTDKRGEVVFA